MPPLRPLRPGGGANAMMSNPMHFACLHKDLKGIKELIGNGFINDRSVNALDLDGTALMWAVRGTAKTAEEDAIIAEIAQLLIDKGAAVNATEQFTTSPLHLAVIEASGVPKYRTIKTLLDAGADLHQKDENFRYTPLHWAVVCGTLEVVELLVERGASAITRNKKKQGAVEDAEDRLHRYRVGKDLVGWWHLTDEEKAAKIAEQEKIFLLLQERDGHAMDAAVCFRMPAMLPRALSR